MKQKVFSILVLLLTTVMSVWAQGSAVTLADGTADAANWTITPGADVAAGSQVTVSYGGSLKVNSLTATEAYIDNVLSNGSFDSSMSGWGGWGGGSQREWDATGGVDGSGALKITITTNSTNIYDITDASDWETPLVAGKTYVLRFKVRSSGTGHVQSCVQQPSGSYPGIGYKTTTTGTDWTTVESQITIPADGNNYTRLCIQTGLDANTTYWMDDVELGEVKQRSVALTEVEAGRQWTMTMPKNSVSLQVDYKPTYKVSFVAGAYFKANEWALADGDGNAIANGGPANPGDLVTIVNNGHRTVNSLTAVEKYIDNLLSNGSFDSGTSDWFGWGGDSQREWDQTGGIGGSGALKISVLTGYANIYELTDGIDMAALEAGKTYVLRFKVRSSGTGHVQSCVQQPSGSYPGTGYKTTTTGTGWTTVETPITIPADGNNYTRLCLQTGKDANTTYWIDDVELGELKERSVTLTEVKASKQWTFTMPANNIELQANCEYYYLALKDGTEDAANWSIGPTREGQTVTINYHGKKKVKSVKAVMIETPKLMASATAEDVGKVIGADGVLYANVTEAKAAGTTACAIVAYVGSETGEASPYNHGLAIAMKDANNANGCNWSTSNIDESQTNYGSADAAIAAKESGSALSSGRDNDSYPAFKAALANSIAVSDGISAAAPVSGTSGWFLASLYQWNKIVQGLTGKTADLKQATNGDYTASNLDTKITAAGATGLSEVYYLSTESNSEEAWLFNATNGIVIGHSKKLDVNVRSVFAF